MPKISPALMRSQLPTMASAWYVGRVGEVDRSLQSAGKICRTDFTLPHNALLVLVRPQVFESTRVLQKCLISTEKRISRKLNDVSFDCR